MDHCKSLYRIQENTNDSNDHLHEDYENEMLQRWMEERRATWRFCMDCQLKKRKKCFNLFWSTWTIANRCTVFKRTPTTATIICTKITRTRCYRDGWKKGGRLGDSAWIAN